MGESLHLGEYQSEAIGFGQGGEHGRGKNDGVLSYAPRVLLGNREVVIVGGDVPSIPAPGAAVPEDLAYPQGAVAPEELKNHEW